MLIWNEAKPSTIVGIKTTIFLSVRGTLMWYIQSTGNDKVCLFFHGVYILSTENGKT